MRVLSIVADCLKYRTFQIALKLRDCDICGNRKKKFIMCHSIIFNLVM